jgi:hypothetical protein
MGFKPEGDRIQRVMIELLVGFRRIISKCVGEIGYDQGLTSEFVALVQNEIDLSGTDGQSFLARLHIHKSPTLLRPRHQ